MINKAPSDLSEANHFIPLSLQKSHFWALTRSCEKKGPMIYVVPEDFLALSSLLHEWFCTVLCKLYCLCCSGLPANVKCCCPTGSPWPETPTWVPSLCSSTGSVRAGLSACSKHLAEACGSGAMPHLAKISFQGWSTSWNVECPRQLDIGGQADFGYPSNSHVMIPKQPRCWKAGDTWGKWLWKIKTVFQPCRHTVW